MTLLTKLLKTMEKNYVAKIQVNQKMRNSKPQKRIQLKLTGTVLGSPPHVREELVPIDEWINSDQDHPRACGKNERTGHEWQRLPGSPPRMREESEYLGGSSTPIRITPAHAGRIRNTLNFSVSLQDHPRACGKNMTLADTAACYLGSPPRMREELYVMRSPPHFTRITPAHAGRITARNVKAYCPEDHPRACGKNSLPA